MKHLMMVSMLIFASASALAEQQVVASTSGAIHVGVKLGPSSVEHNPFGFGFFGGYTLLGPGPRNLGGFQIADASIALEGEYVSLGRAVVSTAEIHKASTFGAVAVATFPLGADLSVIVKAGVSRISHTSNCTPKGCNNTLKVGLHTAAAGQFELTPMSSLQLGLDFYPDGYRLISAALAYKY